MILFGPAGNDEHFYEEGLKSTTDAPKWVNNLGLNAYEYSLARGTNLSEETALKLKNAFAEYNIAISVHAPYYINFACPDEQVEKSYNWKRCSKGEFNYEILCGHHGYDLCW